MEHPVYSFRAVLRELRCDAGLTMLATAEATGYGKYERWESGQTKVGGQYLRSIAEAFAITDDLHLLLYAWVLDQLTPDARGPARRLGLDELRQHVRLAPDTVIDLHQHKALVREPGRHVDLALLCLAARYADRNVVILPAAERSEIPPRAPGAPILDHLYGDVVHDGTAAIGRALLVRGIDEKTDSIDVSNIAPAMADPSTHHGLSQSIQPGTNYSFKREKFKIQATGVFRLLAERTGMRHCWAKDYAIGLSELLPYLPEGYDLFAEGNDQAPDLVPIHSARALFGPGREAWLRIEIEPEVLRQRKLRAESLLAEAKPFGDRFRLVTSDAPTYSYESKHSFTYGKMRSEVVDDLARLYDSTLVASDRSFPGPRKFLVPSQRPKLLSHEAVAFAVLHHLSNVVRYRPADAERILTTRNAWLLTTWVDRACENLLLNLATRITGQDHVIAG